MASAARRLDGVPNEASAMTPVERALSFERQAVLAPTLAEGQALADRAEGLRRRQRAYTGAIIPLLRN